MNRIFFLIGAVSAFVGVAAGAFGAHGLKSRLSEDLLAVSAKAWAAGRWPGALTNASGWFFLAGIVIFSGSLYALSLTGQRWLGAITPIGGLAFLAGWLCLAAACWRN